MERSTEVVCKILMQIRDGARLITDLEIEEFTSSTLGDYLQYLVREDYLTPAQSPDGDGGAEGFDLTGKGFEYITSMCL